MKITKEIFEKSFFSLGGGYDIQPLIRFSHICDFFINVNLFIEKDEVIAWYDKAFKYCSDFEVLEKKVVDEFDEEKYFELNANYIQHLINPDFISREELIEYHEAFSQAKGLNQYAIIYKLYRKSVDRTITFYYCAAEGLASYLALSQNGKYAPIAVSTIETGVLEHPDGIFNKFFKNKKHPKLWVRGFEPRYSPKRLNNDALDSIGLFNNKALEFNFKWTCGWSYYPRQRKVERYCKGYVSNEVMTELNDLTLKEDFKSEKHQFLLESLSKNLERIEKKDYVVVSKKTRLNLDEFNCNILFWEDFTDYHYWWSMCSAKTQIFNLFEILNKKEVPITSTIHIIPFCLEDEGVLYYKSIKTFNYNTMTYLPNVYDFIDLKEVNSHLKQH